MDYERTTDTDELTEWERADGHATIRLRERADGGFAVRYDQLHQADGGRAYAYETVESRVAAEALVADWQADPPA
jgi:hypothetical protein